MNDRQPRWEWIHVPTYGQPDQWIRGRCNHLETVRVDSDGETVAHLCRTCDTQLPAEWEPTNGAPS